MLTVKLRNTQSNRIKIIECGLVDVLPNGRDFNIVVTMDGKLERFPVSRDPALSPFDVAYIENSAGATTQVIRPLINGHG